MRFKLIRHTHLVTKHRFNVFINCCKLGIPFRGLVHDLSKYSPSELFESAKYYNGHSSPILRQRQNNEMYSSICVHHIKKNKHHFEYWIDYYKGGLVLKAMPYKFALEYVADMIAASKVYNKKDFKKEFPLNYFLERKDKYLMNSCTKAFVIALLTEYSKNGFKNLKKPQTKRVYQDTLNAYKQIEIIQVL